MERMFIDRGKAVLLNERNFIRVGFFLWILQGFDFRIFSLKNDHKNLNKDQKFKKIFTNFKGSYQTMISTFFL